MIKRIASIIGDHFKKTLIIYLNVLETKSLISIKTSIKESAIIRGINIQSDILPDIVTELSQQGIIPIVFIDEAQDLYPKDDQPIKNMDKISITDEIQLIINYNDALTFVTGSSVRLASFAHKNVPFLFMNDYPDLNNSRLQTFSLYPILDQQEFKFICDNLNVKYENLHDFYARNGGRIGDLQGKNSSKITLNLLKDDRLLFSTLPV